VKLLYVVHGYKPADRIGGPLVSVAALAEGLVRLGHEVRVCTTNSNLDEDLSVPTERELDVEGVPVTYFRRFEICREYFPWFTYLSRSSGFLYCPKMARGLEELVSWSDIVHTHLPFIYPTFAAARMAKRIGRPLIYHQRGVFDPGRLSYRSMKKRAYIELIEKPIMRQAARLIALTQFEADTYRSLGVSTTSEVIPNGIDCSTFASASPARAEQRWGLAANTVVLLFLGRLHPSKGADRLLRVFLEVAPKVPNAVLVMAGPDEIGMEKRYRQMVVDGNSQIKFIGLVKGAEKRDLLARADLFALPSDGEGFSMAILEAMATSTAVAISPGCHFEEVEAECCGRVIPHQDKAWAATLLQLLESPEMLKQMGQRGKILVQTKYSWPSIVERTEGIYKQILQGDGRR